MLRVRERGAFAGRAHRAEAGRAGADLEFHVPLQGLNVDLAIAKGGDHCHGQSGEIFTSSGHGNWQNDNRTCTGGTDYDMSLAGG